MGRGTKKIENYWFKTKTTGHVRLITIKNGCTIAYTHLKWKDKKVLIYGL